MKILYKNDLIGSTITSSSQTYLYEDYNIIDINSLKTWRSTSTTASVVFEPSSSLQPDTIGIKNHNLTSGATIKIQGNATDSWGSPSVDITLTWREDTIMEFITVGAAYAFWRLSIVDAANTDLYLEVGTVYLGNSLSMPGMTPTQTLGWNTNSIVEYSVSNQPFGDTRADFNTYNVECPVSTNAQRKLIITMFENNTIITPLFISLWEDDQDFEDPEYATILGNEKPFPKDINGNFGINLQFRGVQ